MQNKNNIKTPDDFFTIETPLFDNNNGSTNYRADKPLRSDIYSQDGLVQLSAKLADEHQVVFFHKQIADIYPRFEENAKILEESYYQLANVANQKSQLTPGAEWFLDNYHLIQQHVREIRKLLPKKYYRGLPVLKNSAGDLKNLKPRIYSLALTLVVHSDSVVDSDLLSAFVNAYQEKQPLTIGELWALPIMLRLALLENLRRLSISILIVRAAEIKMQLVIDEIIQNGQGSPTNILLELAGAIKKLGELSSADSSSLIRQLRESGPQASLALNWFEQWLTEKGQNVEELLGEEWFLKAANQISIGNCFTSLKSILSIDWKNWVERNSLVDKVLGGDPASIYLNCDFETRNRYRSSIEGLSKTLKRPELEITEELINFINLKNELEGDTKLDPLIDPLKQKHVGYYLIGQGTSEFNQSLGLRIKFLKGRIFSKNTNFLLYQFSVMVLTICFVLLGIATLVGNSIQLCLLIILAILFIIPASDLAINFINCFLTHLLPPLVLPKLDFSNAVPEDFKTLVVVHVILGNQKSIANQIEFLEIRYLANTDAQIDFAILADFQEGPEQQTSTDLELLKFAQAKIKFLNDHYSPDRIKFFLLTRSRIWNPSENKFMGWERKRGKVMELNRLLRGDQTTSFTVNVGSLDNLQSVKYIITLDTDTSLPHGTAAKLIATMAHPLNFAQFNKEQTLVIEGYGILQPRVDISLTSSLATRFSQIFAGVGGIDPYTMATSDLYQDLFAEGSFVGKGIYNIDVFEKVLANRVPENTILSHDLFEGLFARVGLITDVELYDEFPKAYKTFASRQYRWVRGDWQLLPWMFKKIPDANNNLVKSPLSPLGHWKLIDNLRRSLLAPSCFALLIFCWFTSIGNPVVLTGLILMTLAFSVYAPLASILFAPPIGISISGYLSELRKGFLRNSLQALIMFATLPSQTLSMLQAISVTLYRVYISRKNLLIWETARQEEDRLRNDLIAIFINLLPSFLAGIILFYLILIVQPANLLSALPILSLWILAPLIIFWTTQEASQSKYLLTKKQTASLKQTALDTWKFFDDLVTADSNYLIPDNIQFYPQSVIAYRTSPTNIGLHFLAIISAVDLGFLSIPDAIAKLTKSFETLGKLERYNGHFYNWYDLKNLLPLEPKYISTVDSGNFIGNLIALKSACQDFAKELGSNLEEHEIQRHELNFLQDLCTKLINEIHFEFLYNSRKKLFYIGYDVSSARYDNSYYDLLASESRLASLVAIAKQDIPQEHWFSLGRPLTKTTSGKTLLSWSGTIFEYLMPLLLTKDFPNTLLHESYKVVVKTQRKYTASLGIPWGISESAYAKVDFEHTYQYRAFGVAGTGLKRGLSDDLVISPYSTFLALQVDPREALINLERLESLGLKGKYGFFEAIDYTKERLNQNETGHIIQSFMAHHQGMSLLAINNLLHNNIMQKRFHRDPLIKSVELLLQEKFPDRSPITIPHKAEEHELFQEERFPQEDWSEIIRTPHTPLPRTRVISNGYYNLMIDNAGSGYSYLPDQFALTRWKEDALENAHGTYIFIKDLDSNKIWSITYQPTKVEPDFYEVIFNAEKIEFKRKDFGIIIQTDITVSPEDHSELRRITITNTTNRTRTLQLTTFSEIVLNKINADEVHQAYSKIFLESEFETDLGALIFRRRKHSQSEPDLYMLHMLSINMVWTPIEYETSREAFIGRGRSINNPIIFDQAKSLGNTVGQVLDPIASLRTTIEVEANRSQMITVINLIGRTKEDVLALGNRYQDHRSIKHSFEMAWSKSNIEFRTEQVSIRHSHLYQRLGNALFFQHPKLRSAGSLITKNKLTQSGLWRFGISGDLPIILVRINDSLHLKLVEELLSAHKYLANRSVNFDLLILNENADGYLQNLNNSLEQLLNNKYALNILNAKGGIFPRNLKQLSDSEYLLLQSVARVVLNGEKGSLSTQLATIKTTGNEPINLNLPKYFFKDSNVSSESIARRKLPQLEFPNAIGGFSKAGKAYSMNVNLSSLPPAPWINVIANPNFGFTISETGSGYTWSENCRENRLTTWNNDPVSDQAGEVIYIRDVSNGAFWCPTSLPVSSNTSVQVEHNPGYSQFNSEASLIKSTLVISGSTKESIKWWSLKLKNLDTRPREIEIYLYVEFVLGVLRHQSLPHLSTNFDSKNEILTVENSYNNEFSESLVYLGSNLNIDSYTTSRQEFVGRNNNLSCPSALTSGLESKQGKLPKFGVLSKSINLSGKTGTGLDSCGALQVSITLKPEEEKEVLFFMGVAPSLVTARKIASQHSLISSKEDSLVQVEKYWKDVTNKIQVTTPDRSFDIMMNSWLLYQCLSARIYGRTGFYQSGGAYGFRDQLQDGLALIYTKPEITRDLIVRATTRQFIEGDVQHWWHPPTGRGIRSKISDNFLWLPYVTAKYLAVTNDYAVLEEVSNYLEGPSLDTGQMSSYFEPKISEKTDSVYQHCLLAIRKGFTSGDHGLPLIGAGDWNDGLNHVGDQGKGESVWLAWFTIDILKNWIPILKVREEIAITLEFENKIRQLQLALEEHGWDGEWYRRAFFDDGTPLGSNQNEECKIDSISQSWAVISEAAPPAHAKQAMESLLDKLVDYDNNLMPLLLPPFDSGNTDPGYIKAYPPGIRENGGQYTHAATWAIIATAKLGLGDKAHQLFSMINPINHTSTPEAVDRYRTEPYVTCGDVYSQEPYVGRGGWSWYTGSCGWLYQAGLNHLLGFNIAGNVLTINPCIPKNWPGFQITYIYQGTTYQIEVENPGRVERGVRALKLNGIVILDGFIQLQANLTNLQKVHVLMG